jgi:hypothetical protein
VQALLEPVGGNQTVKEKARDGFVLRKKAYSDILPRHVALPHEISVFVLFTKPPLLEVFSTSAPRSPLLSCCLAQQTEVAIMCSLRQIFHVNQWHFCRFGRTVLHQTISWEAHVGERVNLQSRRALLKQFAPQYREASSVQKCVLLDVFTQTNG